MTNINTLVLLLCFLVLMSLPVSAAEKNTGMLRFEQAQKSFRAQAYNKALRQYLLARKAGLSIPELHYNLGVTYYKLDSHAEAEKEFRQLLNVRKWQATAKYNIGLIYLRRNNRTEAIQWFQRAHNSTDNRKLQLLAIKALKRVGAKPKRLPWRATVSAGLGFDDNVPLNVESETDVINAPKEKDFYAETSVYVRRRFEISPRSTVSVGVNGYSINYQDLTDYDYDTVRLVAFHQYQWDNLRTEVGPYYQKKWYGGSEFQGTAGAQVTARSRFGGTRLRLRYRSSYIDSLDPVYDYLEGNRHQLSTRLGWRLGRQRYWFHYMYELNDREDLQSASGFTSYSANRHRLRLRARQQWPKRWFTEESIQYQRSRYRDETTAGVVTPTTREDDHYRVFVTVGRRIKKNLQVSLEYEYTKNDSNIETNEYRRNLIFLGVRWRFSWGQRE